MIASPQSRNAIACPELVFHRAILKMLNQPTTNKNESRIFSGKRFLLYEENLSLKQAKETQQALRQEGIRTRRLKDSFGYYAIYSAV